jgi:hypothetical protein
MSDYQRALVSKLGGKLTECVKLVPNLRNKERYVLHCRNLKLYNSLGLRVTKIHKAAKFRQEAWMAPYIQIHSVKSKLKLNRSIYVGQAVLDLSKYRMYDFWYNHLKRLYGEKAQLLYTDTDSLLYKVGTENVYEDMRQHAEEYDFSDYPKDHPCYSVENKKVVGKFKEECLSRPIAEFVSLRPKMYSIHEACWSNIMKAKGVSKTVVKKDLRHDMYKDCLVARKEFRHIQTAICNHGHQIGLYEQNKVGLSPLDNKKWIADDGITTRAYGHYLRDSSVRATDAAMEKFLNEICG